MRTPIIFLKALIGLAFILALLTVFSCGNRQENPSDRESQSSVSVKKVRPPEMSIHAAALMGNVAAIRRHIEAGTDLDLRDEYGATPLTVAATFGKTDVARALIKAGADVNLKNREGSTPLHIAAFFCRTGIVEALLAHGADKSLKNNYGNTALETVSYPFAEVKGIYDQISRELGPLGLKLDYQHIQITRPRIAEMLQ